MKRESGWYYGKSKYSDLKVIGFYDGEQFIIPNFITPSADLEDFILYGKAEDADGNFSYNECFKAPRNDSESI